MTRRAAGGLPKRVDLLEKDVETLDRRVDTLEVHTGLREADQPAELPEKAAASPRCPGCRLEVKSTRAARCEWCGFVFRVARPTRGED